MRVPEHIFISDKRSSSKRLYHFFFLQELHEKETDKCKVKKGHCIDIKSKQLQTSFVIFAKWDKLRSEVNFFFYHHCAISSTVNWYEMSYHGYRRCNISLTHLCHLSCLLVSNYAHSLIQITDTNQCYYLHLCWNCYDSSGTMWRNTMPFFALLTVNRFILNYQNKNELRVKQGPSHSIQLPMCV